MICCEPISDTHYPTLVKKKMDIFITYDPDALLYVTWSDFPSHPTEF